MTSLTSIESITGKDDLLEIGDLIEFPLDAGALAETRERALANELYVGNVVSAGGDFTCIIARLPHDRARDIEGHIADANNNHLPVQIDLVTQGQPAPILGDPDGAAGGSQGGNDPEPFFSRVIDLSSISTDDYMNGTNASLC